jgi:hypothetical protein
MNAEAYLADAQRQNESHIASTSDLEARLMNAEARLADAQRKNESYATSISDLEARLANAEACLADAMATQQDAELASADNTMLERLFEAYGLIDLAREVKARRLKVKSWRKAAKAD